MKRFFYTGLLILICKTTTWAQTGSDLYWTWMKGNKYATTIPHYGAKGIPADENLPPARYAAATWTDAQGIFWLFGGSRSNSLMYNDLWNFNPVTRQWTWVAGDSIPNQYGDFGTQGQASPDNRPAARQHAMAWIDDRQHLWMFGGNYNYNGVEYGMYGDLWKFDLRIQQWIWVNGSRTNNARPRLGSRTVPNPNNYPGAAYMASTWIDLQGRCWMYGGGAYNETGTQPTWTNRLWMFDPVTEIWTWMKGDARGFDTSFGIQQVPSASNCPGQRLMATTWTDVRGQLWLFGGELADGRKGNDLWKFDIRTNNWIWMKGSVPPPLINDYWPAQYGVRDLPASANNPGSRQGAAGGTNGNDKLFLFGGLGTITEHNLGHLNDLWSYDIPTNTWTWLKGDSSIVAPGDYGIFLQPDINNAPPGRSMVAAWKDLSGNNWLFGGESYLADVWRLSGTGFTDSTTVRLSGRAFGDDLVVGAVEVEDRDLHLADLAPGPLHPR
ncbi:MAG TPA: kelch repeat-containing protein, partial [Ferruginibacter sp.]|nr:kelch repeat-containing protein [Ferruginibacter sp.]